MIELLSPVGDFECLKSAVQNGADTVYFGANLFNARAFANNFDDKLLEKAINYAKLRGVKTNLTLNTLIKNHELADAINLAKKAYQFGIDAIIVQDLGLARYLIKHFPGLQVHGSTQMSVHNLEGVKELQKLGFSRVVLSRELNISEIDYICKNSNIETEVFIHGALCISYSGQCLFSSLVGGRSGNRGKCAQPCRLPYELLENDSIINKGYLLSTRDLCGLEYLPKLVKAGVSCLKIEGRMKTPEYVATVTRIYRKYLDMALSNDNFVIDDNDKQELLQVFNRGNFSCGHLSPDPNRELIYKNKSNNMGIYLGKISNFNNNKGHITFTSEAVLRHWR
jgi:putative protease